MGNATLGAGGTWVFTLLMITPLALANVAARATPTIFWASDDVQPGDAVLVYGGPFDSARRVIIGTLPEGKPGFPGGSVSRSSSTVRAEVFQPKVESVKFQIPSRLPKGIYRFQVETAQGSSNTFYLNRPEVRFVQPTKLLPGLGRNEASPGSILQVIGLNLISPTGQGTPCVALRKGGSKWTILPSRRAEKYSLWVALPPGLPIGEYILCVHNGSGGGAGWSDPFRFSVKQPERWPERVFNVRDFGARGNDVDDDTAAVRAALKAAEENGGGVVFFPWGIYRLSDWLFVPARTTLRGEDRETTWLKWPQTEPSSPDDLANAVIYTASQCALENLSLMVRNAQVCVRDLSWGGLTRKELSDRIRPPGGSRDLFLRRVRIQHLYLCGRPKGAFFDRYERQDMLTIGMNGVGNVEVSDCEFSGTQRFLNLDNARFDGNSFSNQHFLSWTDLGGSHFVFQNNVIRGASSWRGFPLEFIYSAHNTSFNLERGEREALTFDINDFSGHKGGPWFGKVASAEGVTLKGQDANWLPDDLVGLQVLIVAGRGSGQYRTIISNTADTVILDRAWDVQPDSESVVAIYGLRRHAIIYDCDGSDTSAMAQLWGTYFDMIIDGCRARRDQGIWGLGGWFIQMKNNQLTSGLSFHPGIGAWGINPEGCTPYGYLGLLGAKLLDPTTAPTVRGAIIRNNRLSFNHRIALRAGYVTRFEYKLKSPAVVDVIIDNNSVDHSAVGIETDSNVAGVFLARNRMEEVNVPVVSGGDVWLHPGERLAYQLEGARRVLGKHLNITTSLTKAIQALRQEAAGSADKSYGHFLSRLWSAVSESGDNVVPHELFTLLIGLRVEFDATSPLFRHLAAGRGGLSELRLKVGTAAWAPAVRVLPQVILPDGWQTPTPTAPVTISPGSSQTITFPLQTPPSSDVRSLPVSIAVELDGHSLIYESQVDVGTREVRNWMIIGPFANRSGNLPDTGVHPAEVRLDLNGTYEGLEGKITWQPQVLPDKYCHFDRIFRHQSPMTAYALAVFRAEENMTATLNLWCRGSMEAWLNDEKILSLGKDGGRVLTVSLRKGENVLLCKSSVLSGQWEIAAELNGMNPGNRLQVRQLTPEEMKSVPALTPPPLKPAISGSLAHDAGIAWREVYSDDFERRILGDRWHVASGNWQIKEGVLVGGQRSFISFAEKVAAPLRIEYEARSAAPYDLSCSWFRDPGDLFTGYLISFAAAEAGSRVQLFGDRIGTSEAPEAKALPNRWYHVIAQILPNGTVQLYANEKKVLDIPGSSRPTEKAYPGLWTWGGGEFDNVRIYTAN